MYSILNSSLFAPITLGVIVLLTLFIKPIFMVMLLVVCSYLAMLFSITQFIALLKPIIIAFVVVSIARFLRATIFH